MTESTIKSAAEQEIRERYEYLIASFDGDVDAVMNDMAEYCDTARWAHVLAPLAGTLVCGFCGSAWTSTTSGANATIDCHACDRWIHVPSAPDARVVQNEVLAHLVHAEPIGEVTSFDRNSVDVIVNGERYRITVEVEGR